MERKKQCTVHIYTGNGSGKTTSALGVALRSVGHDHKVNIVQFMKGRKDIGEYMIMDKLKPMYEIVQFGKDGWVDLKEPSLEDCVLAGKGIDYVRNLISEDGKLPDLLILDEVNLAAAKGLLKIDDVLDLLYSIPKEIHVYMTGRDVPEEFVDIADIVVEINNIKYPGKMEYVKGIEY